MVAYLVVGPPGNLEIGINEKIWGLPSSSEKMWQKLVPGDELVFYATTPVKGIVGYARVESTLRDASLLWPQEKKTGHSQWPLRVKLRNVRAMPASQWVSQHVPIGRKGLQRSFQRLQEDRSKSLVQGIDSMLCSSDG